MSRVIPGPDIHQPFRVASGIAVVFTPSFGFPLPVGSTWPGDRLPDDLALHLQPVSVELLYGTLTTPLVSEADLQAGIAFVHAIALMKGQVPQRMALIPPDVARLTNRNTLAGALSVSREYLTKHRS